MNKYAVIVAGGSGSRMGASMPKQFLLVNDKPVLYYTMHTFLEAYNDLEVILVLPIEFMDMGQEIIDAYFDNDRVKITAGGDTRFQSVKNGLQLIENEGIIFVHDGVRCLLTKELIHRCYAAAVETGTGIPVVECKDSVRIITDEQDAAVDRNRIRLVQTPQTFHSKILLPAFQIDYKDKFTDEATVVEAYGMKLTLVKGEENNIKLTQPIDLAIAAAVLEQRQ